MRIVYTARSRQDLAEIVDGLASRNVHAALVVAATIRKRIAWLARYPSSGRAQEGMEVRKAITEPFGYLIYYVADETAQTVTVIAILPPTPDRV